MNEQGQTININVEDCEDVVCKNCGSPFFVDAVLAKRIPGLLVGAPEDQAGFSPPQKVCSACSTPFMVSFLEPPETEEKSPIIT